MSTANVNAVDSRPIGRENCLQSASATAQLSGSRLLRSSAAAHTEACAERARERERERGGSDANTAFQTTPQRTDIYKVKSKKTFWQVFEKYSGKHSRLCLKLTYTAEKEHTEQLFPEEQLCFLQDILPFLNWEY